jgi:RNA polymerase sigma-70 factor, ECF subfamily
MDAVEFEGVMIAARNGAEWAWSKLYRAITPQLLGYVRIRGASDPEGLVGEVWLQLVRGLDKFSGDWKGFRSWVFLVAHHRLSNERRRFVRKATLPLEVIAEGKGETASSAEAEVLEDASSYDALGLLDILTPDQRSVIALRVIAGFSVEETAEILKKQPGAVKQLQRRGLATLRQSIEQTAVTR